MARSASKLLLVAHEALETERDIQGAVEQEEPGVRGRTLTGGVQRLFHLAAIGLQGLAALRE